MTSTAWRIVGLGVVSLLLVVSVRAQTPSVFPVRPGTLEGNINETVPNVRYSFEARAGDSVSILMETTSGDLDPLLILSDPKGEAIERNDDRVSGDRNAEIALTLFRAGTYVIEATRFENGTSSGTFRLTLAISNTTATDTPDDPLATPPVFGVRFTTISYQQIVNGGITAADPTQYYAIGAQQGDLVRIVMTRTSDDLLPRLGVLNSQGEDISRESQTQAGEYIATVTFPETGWYLLQASALQGTGRYDLYTSRLADAVLQIGQSLTNTFVPQTTSLSYIINARIGDLIAVTMFATDAASGVTPSLELLDLSLNVLAQVDGDRFATMRATIPRSAPYIVRASNRRPEATGDYNLRLTSVPADKESFAPVRVNYNSQQSGTISDVQPLDFYRFSGKTDELVTVTMTGESAALDSFLILMDSDLNELAANDNVEAQQNARITQYRLPKDGEYLIIAARAGLRLGVTSGEYQLALTVGEIDLDEGAFSATLTWTGSADLNLFVRDPRGRIVSWSAPQSPTGGTLQVDSNTNCQTPSDQPVEHVFWEQIVPGDYEVWAWYQDGCGRVTAADYTLTLQGGTTVIRTLTGSLNVGQRFQIPVRIFDDGSAFVLSEGEIADPTPQQRASEGGDQPLRAGEVVSARLDDQVFARFYRFQGEAGTQVIINAARTSGDLDVVLVLGDADNNPLPDATNDDANPTTSDAQLIYTLPTTDTYVIAVTRFGVRDGVSSGTYELTLAVPLDGY